MNYNQEEHSALFVNCHVWQPDNSFAKCFGIRNNKFNFIGAADISSASKKNYDKIVDLNGRLVIPGLHDSHCHFVCGSLDRKLLDCSDIHSLAQLTQRISDYKNKNPWMDWIICNNFHANRFEDKLDVTALDAIENSLPIILKNYDYHSAYCNSPALKRSDLFFIQNRFNEDELPKSSSGKIEGIVKEHALSYVLTKIPETSVSKKAEAITDMQKILHSYGITSISDISTAKDLEIYKNLYGGNNLHIRINSYLPITEFDNSEEPFRIAENIPKEIFHIKGVKVFYDGALGSKTALYSSNYNNSDSQGYRTEITSDNLLLNLLSEVDKNNLQCAVHAIGDLAVSEVIELCRKLQIQNGKKDRRFRIEHAQHISEDDFEKFKELDIIASVQPIHLKYDYDIALKLLPQTILNRTHNYKELVKRNVPVCFGTDFPVADINPFENIQTALTRIINGNTFQERFRFMMNECIRAYTYFPAYSTFNENRLGLIREGYLADFVILEDNIFTMYENNIHKARVYKTFFDGKEVYSV